MPSKKRSRRATKNSSRNAEKHGFFSREIRIPEAETAEYSRWRAGLLGQLAPNTPLQRLAADQVVYCAWHCKRAARAEGNFWSRSVPSPISEEQESGGPAPAKMNGWFGAGAQELNDGIHFLRRVIAEYAENHRLRDDSKEQLAKAFGSDFVERIERWTPTDPDAVLTARMLTYKYNCYGSSLPLLEEGKKHFIPDPQQQMEMIAKLLEERLSVLTALRLFLDQKWASASRQEILGAMESPRYFAGAMRDLHRALAWFDEVRTKGW